MFRFPCLSLHLATSSFCRWTSFWLFLSLTLSIPLSVFPFMLLSHALNISYLVVCGCSAFEPHNAWCDKSSTFRPRYVCLAGLFNCVTTECRWSTIAEFQHAVRSPGTSRADMWGDRGTVMVKRPARCRTTEPTPSGAYRKPACSWRSIWKSS